MTAAEIREHFVSRADWIDRENTVDQIIIGDPDKEVRRVLVTWISSFEAVRAAVTGGHDALMTHEPTFYAHRHELQNMPDADIAREKKGFLEESGLTIIRNHDVWDRMPKVGIPWAWGQFLGMGAEPVAIGAGGYQHRYDVDPTTVDALAGRIAARTAALGEPCVQVIGDGSRRVSKVGVGTGCACGIPAFLAMGCDISVVCDDGSTYWSNIQCAADAGHPVIRVNHGTSEEPGMVTLTRYVNETLSGVTAEHLPHGSCFRPVGAWPSGGATTREASPMLHLHCGDSSAETLRRAGVPGEAIVWCDIVMDGPTPAGVVGEEWIALRARHLADASGGALTVEGVAAWLGGQQKALETFRDHDEAVLWFDACLFDQSILIRQLDWFGRQDLGETRLSLICVGEHPDFGRFAGLGELNPEQMAALLKTRHEVTREEIDLATRAWAAFRSADPRDLETVLAHGTDVLPYLGEALVRHLEQFPSVRNGLNRLENAALEVIAGGESKLGPLFVAVSAQEDRPFIGDTYLWGCLDELAQGDHPLLEVEGPGRLPLWEPKDIGRWSVTATDTGRQVSAGEADWVKLNGIDRWLGGVHLCGDETQWRWDEAQRTLVGAAHSAT